MGAVLTGGGIWNVGYRIVGMIQMVLTVILFVTLPAWEKQNGRSYTQEKATPLKLRQVIAIPGAKEIMTTFFCYCAIEQTSGLWAASFMTLDRGMAPETAASLAAMYYIGITVGRFISGFVAMRLSDNAMIRVGLGIMALGMILLLIPVGWQLAAIGLMVMGLGCAPVYPSIIHSTPEHFGVDKSQALVGVQMASAYVGTSLMPPLFGLIADHISINLLPVYLLALLGLMGFMYYRVGKSCGK